MPAQLSHRLSTLTTLALLTSLLAACTAPAASPAANAVPPTSPPAVEPTAQSVSARPLAELDLRAELTAFLSDQLAPTPTAAADGSQNPAIDGVAVLPLLWSDADPLFAASTTGMTVDGVTPHRVELYRYSASTWQKLGEVALPESMYLDPAGMSQVALDDSHIWITVQSGVGAHGGCYDLLLSDGKTLESVQHACSESPDTAMLVDIDNDGYGELLINQTDHYVFCYACGIKNVSWRVLRWDGSQLVEKPLAAVSGADAAAETANRAFDLAMAGRWKQADELLGSTSMSGNLDAAWLAAVIRVNARLRQAEITDSPYPLLSSVLAGDFAAATAVLRAVPAAQAADSSGPLITGTVAEGNEAALWTTIVEVTARALAVEPDDPDALLLRGWAGLMQDGADAGAAEALQRAAELAPDDAFIRDLSAALR